MRGAMACSRFLQDQACPEGEADQARDIEDLKALHQLPPMALHGPGAHLEDQKALSRKPSLREPRPGLTFTCQGSAHFENATTRSFPGKVSFGRHLLEGAFILTVASAGN